MRPVAGPGMPLRKNAKALTKVDGESRGTSYGRDESRKDDAPSGRRISRFPKAVAEEREGVEQNGGAEKLRANTNHQGVSIIATICLASFWMVCNCAVATDCPTSGTRVVVSLIVTTSGGTGMGFILRISSWFRSSHWTLTWILVSNSRGSL